MIHLDEVITNLEDPSCAERSGETAKDREVLRFCCRLLKEHRGGKGVFGGNPEGKAVKDR